MDDINKAGGEGSRGGTIIGHSPSGKPIYRKASHEDHKTFSPEDHKAAANLHEDIYNRANKKLQDRTAAEPGYKPDQKVYDFIQHHQRQMASHTGGAQKPRNVSESSKGAKAKEEKKEKDPGAHPSKSEKKEFKSKLDNKVIVDTVNRLRGEGKTAEARRIYDKHINKAYDLLEALGKGGAGSGKKGHKTEGLSEAQLHDRRNKFAGSQYAKFRNHSGEGLNDADKFKHGMVQDAKNSGYVEKSGYEGYTSSDNARRKANNIETGQSTGGAVGRRVKAYGGSGSNAAGKEAAEMRRRSKKNPVKVWSPEEIAALNADLAPPTEGHGRGPDKGPRKKRVEKSLRKAKYIKREGSKGQYKYTYDDPKMGSAISHSDAIKAAHGKHITFSGPGNKEYAAHVYSEPEDGKVILKFDGHGFRRVEIASIKNMHIQEAGATVAAVPLEKKKSLGWPPSGFVEPSMKGNKTTEKDWYKEGSPEKDGRPSTQGKKSNNVYMSPKGSTCNLVGQVAFGKASDLAQRQLNQKLQMTEVLLTDMGIKMKTPMDFICQDMEDGQRGVMAQFLPMNHHRNDRINLAKNLKTVNKSLLHEIGHGIDYAMEQRGLAGSYFRGNPPELRNELDALTKVLVESKFYEATGAKDAPGNIGDDFLEPDDRYASYLKDQSEVFARAFEVYTYSHALDMVAEGKLPKEYTENIVPDFVKAGFSHGIISDPVKLKQVLGDVTEIMDKIFSKRGIQKAMQNIDLLETLRKNVVATDDQGSATETGMYSNDLYSNASNPLMGIIKDALEDHMFGSDPVQIIIAPGTVLTATKVDDGVYSGHVTREMNGEVENVLKIEKQTLPTLLQFLKVKELIPTVVAEPVKMDSGSDYKMKVIDLLDKLL